MKRLLFILLLSPLLSVAQTETVKKYILIDRTFNRPAIFADIVTKENLKNGYFPIIYSEFDSTLTFINSVKNVGKLGVNRTFLNNDDYKATHTYLDIVSVQAAYGDKYDIDIVSNTEYGIFKIRMSNAQMDVGRNKYAINTFVNYLTRTKKEIEKNKKSKS